MQIHDYAYGEYLSLERESETRHEFIDGEIYAMTGGSPAHARIAAKVISMLDQQLEGSKCRVFTGDLRIRAVTPNVTTYPDVSIVCGEPILDPDDRQGHGITNPTVVVEVTSPSTERYDRGRKLGFYQTIESLEAVVIVSHREPLIEVHLRDPKGGWTSSTATQGRVEVPPIDCHLELARIYAG